MSRKRRSDDGIRAGLANFFDLYRPLADEWQFYDNSGPGNAILVAEGGEGRGEIVYGADRWSTILQTAAKARETT